MKTRREFDSIGVINVPNERYWGASTQRSKKFFNIGKILVPSSIIRSIAIIKRSAAIVHKKNGLNFFQNFKRNNQSIWRGYKR